MSNWRDQLRPGSFRNVPFKFADGDIEFGRRIVVHEYPLRDKPWAEDMGRKARKFSLTLYVLGDNYMAGRDALIAAIEKPGSGELIHPRYGRLIVSAVLGRQRETTREGGYAQFNVTFVESGDKKFPISKPDTSAQVAGAADHVIDEAVAEYTKQLSPSENDFIVNDAIAQINQFGDEIRNINKKINSSLQPLSDVAQAVDNLSNGAKQLISQPRALGTAIVSVITTLTVSTSEIINSLKGDRAGSRSALESSHQLTQFAPVIDRPNMSSAVTAGAEYNRVQTKRLIWRVAEAEACRACSKIEFKSYNDAVAVRQLRYANIEQLLMTVKPALYRALIELRSAMINDIIARGGSLARIGNHTLPKTLPSLLLAYQLYGDASKADSIVRRNKISHPGFLPGGESLEILSE